jgi:hypothetical protein
LGEGQLDDRLVDGTQTIEQELRVEAVVIASPLSSASMASLAFASSPEPASRVREESSKASCTAVLRSATSATRLTASISVVTVDLGYREVFGREEVADLRELAVEQPRGRTA